MKTYTKEEVVKLFKEHYEKQDYCFHNLKPFLKEWKLLDEEFEVGKFARVNQHTHPQHESIILIAEGTTCKYDSIKIDGTRGDGFYDRNLISVEDSEVSTALITEAKKRGFKEGVKYIWENCPKRTVSGNNFIYEGGVLRINGFTIMDSNGKWATIIEEEKEFLIQVQKGTIIIDGKEYTAEEIINKFNK